MTRRYFIGLSSGASMLGVDAALVRTEGMGSGLTFGLDHFVHAPFGRDLRDLLLRTLHSPTPETRHLGTLHRVLGETYALAVRQLLQECNRTTNDVLAIGCPGLTLWHDGDGRYPATLGLGMMGVLAERTGLTTLSDFGSRDLALGGQGTPCSALVDAMLFHDAREDRAVVHLGSTASIVFLPAQAGPSYRNVVGFEAAPCTMLLDGLMRLMTNGKESIDVGGKHAVQGRCLEPLLERWMQNHYFHKHSPKCVPRSEFGAEFLMRGIEQGKRIDGGLHDVLCTMTHFIAQAIVHALQSFLLAPPARLLLSGRGIRNGFLWHLLEQKLPGIPLEKTDAHGIPSEARQAVACAGIAALTLDQTPVTLPTVTGASSARVVGQWTPGNSANWARCLAWMAQQATPVRVAAA